MQRQDRNSNGGGVLSYTRESFQPLALEEVQNRYVDKGLELTITRITAKGPIKHVNLVSIYRPPGTPVSWYQTLESMVIDLMTKGPLVILGDLNADLLRPRLNNTRLLKKALALGRLKVPSILPTRVCSSTSTCLDIIAIPDEIPCSEYRVVPIAASDHFLVEASLNLSPATISQPVIKRSYKKVNIELLRQRASQIELAMADNASPDDMLNEWNRSITGLLDEFAPLKAYPICKKKCKWLTADVRGLMLQRDAIARRIAEVPNPTAEMAEECRKLKRKVKSRMRRASREYGTEAMASGETNRAWEFIRAATFSSTRGERVTMDLLTLNNAFAEVVTSRSPLELAVPPTCNTEHVLELQPLHSRRVERLLTNLKTRTATGPDGLSASLLKTLAPAIAPNLATIMNRSMAIGSFPSVWKRANVAAVWKGKGSKTDAGNYRPISILPVLARMFEREVAGQLAKHCYAFDIIPNEQFGFRPKSNCEMALIAATDEWLKQMDEGKIVGSLLIDLSKAFDTVPHQQLLRDLQEIGCSQQVCQWFYSYLEGREQRVSKGPVVTEWKEVTRGVPQGSCLSPLLFNVFVRRLPAASSSPSIQFADDLTQSEADRDAQQVLHRLTESFKEIKSFCEQRELVINTNKTQLILFKTPQKHLPDDLRIVLDGIPIEPSACVKLLGVTLDRHLTFKEHIDKTVKKCNGVVGMLARAAPYMPRELLRIAYIALARSHLEYASAAFMSASATQLKKLNTVQKVASRVICRVPRDTHSAPLLAALRLESLESRREAHAVQIVRAALDGNTHPSLARMFTRDNEGRAENTNTARIQLGNRRFSTCAKYIYNRSIVSPSLPPTRPSLPLGAEGG